MTLAVGLANLVLGTVYTCYGLMTAYEMRHGANDRASRHFGMAWLAMAFTCGPHHLDHAAHLLLAGRPGTGLELLTLAVGFPAGVTWFALRVEAMFGGSGDRVVDGRSRGVALLPLAGAIYAVSTVGAASALATGRGSFDLRVTPNLALVALYAAIGTVLAATQLRNHAAVGSWSLSGVSLSAVMFTCAVMHLAYAAQGQAAAFALDVHGLTIAVFAVPAAAYFLWVVAALHRGQLRDWSPSKTLVTT